MRWKIEPTRPITMEQDSPSPNPNPNASRELNLQQMVNQVMTALQRHFDMLAYTLASRENATQETYLKRVRDVAIMPVPQLHQNFEQIEAHARDLLLRQVINDAMNLSITALNNCHLFLALLKEKKNSETGELGPEEQKRAQAAQQAFLKAKLEKKFELLEQNYGILCELEDSITGLAYCLQALLTQNGIPREAQLDESGLLKVDLIAAAPTLDPVPNLHPNNLRQVVRSFQEDQIIDFSELDMQNMVLTVGVFAQHLFAAVAKYANA
jgi:hypothetical protein